MNIKDVVKSLDLEPTQVLWIRFKDDRGEEYEWVFSKLDIFNGNASCWGMFGDPIVEHKVVDIGKLIAEKIM